VPGAAKAIGGSIKGIKSTVDASKTIGPLAGSNVVKVAGNAGKGFADEAGQEALDQAVHGENLDAAAILGAGVFGLGSGIGKGGGAGKGGPGGPPGSSDRGLFGKKGKSTASGSGSGGSSFLKGILGKNKSGQGSGSQPPPQPPPPHVSGPVDTNIPPGHLPSAQAVPGPAHLESGGSNNPPLVFRTTDRPLFRDDTRDHDTIFREGFKPKLSANPQPFHGNLRIHNNVSTADSGFVSATKVDNLDFNGGDGPLFEIHAPGGIDTSATLGREAIGFDREVAFPGGIRTENIFGARPRSPGGTLQPFVANPNFNPHVENPLASHQPFHPTQPAAPAPQSAAPTAPTTSQPAQTSNFTENFDDGGPLIGTASSDLDGA